jgi:hypothetical protein
MKDKRIPPLTAMFTDIEISFHLLQQNPTRTFTNPFREKLNTIFKNICYHEFIKEPHIVKTIRIPQLRAHFRFMGREGKHTFPIIQMFTCTSVGLTTVIK